MIHTHPLRFIGILLLLLLLLPACSNPEQKKEKHYARAMEYIKQDNSDAAVLELRNAIQIDPKYASARYQLGLLQLEKGDARAAFGELQRAANLDPNNLDANLKVAEFYLLSKNKEESRKYVSKVLQVDPNYVNGLALLANLELLEGNFQAAEEAVNTAMAHTTESDKFYNIKGRIFAAQKKWYESRKMFQKAVELGPDSFANYRTLLMFYQQQKLTDEAKELLNTIISTFPDDPQAHILLASHHQAAKEYDKAEEALLKVVEVSPDSIPYRLMIADFYKKQRRYDDAVEFLTTALTDFPDSPELKASLADLKFNMRKFDEARTLMENILTTNPSHAGANFVKAKLAFTDSKFKEAKELLVSLTDNYPKWAEPLYFLALTHLRLGELELAQKANTAALQLNPANSQYHALQSQILLIQGESDPAGREATIALQIDSHNFAAAKLLAKALLQSKHFDDAIKLIGDIQKQVPDDIELIGSLGLAYLGSKDKDKAKESFARLLELAPNNSKALALLTTLSAGGDLKSALTIVNEQITRAPEAAGHYLILGDLLIRKQEHEAALAAFAKAQELAPNNPQAYIVRARLMHRLGKTDEAIAEFNTLLQSQPNSIPANLGIATLMETQGDYVKAKEQYLKVLDIQPDLPAAANNLAYLIATEENGDLGEALRLAMLAKQALPDDPHIADTLGWVHYKREAFGLATTQFQQALSTRPEDPIITYHLALAQYGNGEKEAAIATLQQALESSDAFQEREEAEQLLQQWQSE